MNNVIQYLSWEKRTRKRIKIGHRGRGVGGRDVSGVGSYNFPQVGQIVPNSTFLKVSFERNFFCVVNFEN